MASIPFALQLYTVRDHMEKDAAATLKRVKEIGYDHVELAGTAGRTPKEFKAMLDNAGLTPVSSHYGMENLAGGVDEAVREAEVFGIPYLVVPWVKADTAAGWLAIAAQLDEAGAALRNHGIQLCYHNHAHEFERYDGELAFTLLMTGSKPEHLAAEIDTYWVRFGGEDPVATINQYAGRCPLLHIKDMAADEARSFAEVGRGVIDWKPIFAAGYKAGVEWFIAEQDVCPGDSLECARISAEFMKHQTF